VQEPACLNTIRIAKRKRGANLAAIHDEAMLPDQALDR
jgi:hypothetical protein